MAVINQGVGVCGDALSNDGGKTGLSVDPLYGAGRHSLRPIDYTAGPSGAPTSTLGHYRAVSFSGAVNSISAAGILYSAVYGPSVTTQLAVITRFAVNLEVLTAITTAAAMDVQAFLFRGATGKASGTSSTTLTLTTNNQKMRTSMGAPQWAAGTNGEVRTIGTTTALTAAAGKTNDSAPFGAAFFGSLFNSTATGTAVLVSPGAALAPGGWQDLFVLQPGVNHPPVLVANEGVEAQVITANNTSGTVKYGFLLEWVEVVQF